MSDPQTISAISTLIGVLVTMIVAITALIKQLQHEPVIKDTNQKVTTIQTQTNGVLTDLQTKLDEATQRNTQTGRAADPHAPDTSVH